MILGLSISSGSRPRHATSDFFISTSSPESNISFSVLHDISLADVMNMPSVVGPFSLKYSMS